MDTSENLRLAADAILVGSACIIGLTNLRLAIRLLAGRKVNRMALVWPILLVVYVIAVLDAFCWEPYWVQVTRTEVRTAKLPRGFRLRIVQLSDLHMSHNMGVREARMLGAVRRLRPDLIVMTGDYTNDLRRQSFPALTRVATRLRTVAPVYAVEGNWDNGGVIDALEKGGARYLHGWLEIGQGKNRIALGGADWYSGETGSMPGSCRGLYRVVMCHSPWHFFKLRNEGADLVLAGHTHGGQLRLPIFGTLLPARKLIGQYQMGMYESRGTKMYVNRGLGCEGQGAPQVRLFCRPEVALIEIVGEGNSSGEQRTTSP
jgi:predicted MPP superfamily phosphohydrolase